GRTGQTRNLLCPSGHRGFESLSLRHTVTSSGAVSLERSRNVGYTLTVPPAVPKLGLLLRREPRPCVPLHTHTSSSGKIRRCCVDRLNSPTKPVIPAGRCSGSLVRALEGRYSQRLKLVRKSPGQGYSSSFFNCQDGLVRAPAFGLQELVTVFGDLLLVIDEAIHDASAARLDAGTEPSRILPTGLHALLVPQAHFQRVVTRIGDVVLVIEQTINY